MRDETSEAFRAVNRAAWAIVESVVQGLISELQRGNIDPDDISDAVHEACDSACVYTADQYALAWGLRDPSEDPISDMGCQTWDQALACRAFQSLREVVESNLELGDAIEVARDARLERGLDESAHYRAEG